MSTAVQPGRTHRLRTFIIVIVILVVIGSAISKGTTTTNSSGVDRGLASQDASADISHIHIGPADAIGLRPVSVTVTNHSSKRSNYIIELSIDSPNGTIQYDTTTVLVNGLEPGQVTVADGLPITHSIPSTAVVHLKTVSRFAA